MTTIRAADAVTPGAGKIGSDFTVKVYPGLEPRLLRPGRGRESLNDYLAAGGYANLADESPPGSAAPGSLPNAGSPLGETRTDLAATVVSAGLRGRGGAAFPTGMKLISVRDIGVLVGKAPVVLINGEEGEPASVKDRWLLTHRPHLAVDGARLAAAAVGADTVYLYASDERAISSLRSAVDEIHANSSLSAALPELRLATVAPSYVAGEETAAVQSINGGPAKPTDKPPRPYESGVDGRPTLVSNVETVSNLPYIADHGATHYRSVGSATSPGTLLMTLGGSCNVPGLYEVPFGERVEAVLDALGGTAGDIRGFLMGGYFAGVMNSRALALPLTYDDFADAGTGLGCGSIVVLGSRDCPVSVVTAVMAFFDRENAGQCGSCFNGIAAMTSALTALTNGQAQTADIENLTRWATFLRGRGACATLDGATNLVRSLMHDFPDDVAEHLTTHCALCEEYHRSPAERPFAVDTTYNWANTLSGSFR